MHWFVSQSLFFVAVRVTDTGVEKKYLSYHTLGYSAIAMVFVMIVGAAMIFVVTAWGFFFRLPPGIPVARSCSLVFSAACHNPNGKVARLEAVQWGAVDGTNGFDHFMIDSGEAQKPDPKALYE